MNRKKNIYILVIFVMVLFITSCTRLPTKIENYVNSHYSLEVNDSCYIDLRQVLGIDYDRMYVFPSFTPVSGIGKIIGVNGYGVGSKDALIGYDSEMCKVFLIKEDKVVFEDEYHYNNYNFMLDFISFDVKRGFGEFDQSIIPVYGYEYKNYIFKIKRTENDIYLIMRI